MKAGNTRRWFVYAKYQPLRIPSILLRMQELIASEFKFQFLRMTRAVYQST